MLPFFAELQFFDALPDLSVVLRLNLGSLGWHARSGEKPGRELGRFTSASQSYLLEIKDHSVGFVEAKGFVHSLAGSVLQGNVRGEFGAAPAFCPVFNGPAKKASKTTSSISWLDIQSLAVRQVTEKLGWSAIPHALNTTWEESAETEHVAWAAPGVTEVHNQLTVEP